MRLAGDNIAGTYDMLMQGIPNKYNWTSKNV